MSVKMNEFLLQYYKQLRFNSMPPEVRAQFDVYLKADDFRGHMEKRADDKWREQSNARPDRGKWRVGTE